MVGLDVSVFMAAAPFLYRVYPRVSSLACGGNSYQEMDAEEQEKGHQQLLIWDPVFVHQCCSLVTWIKQHERTVVVNMSR